MATQNSVVSGTPQDVPQIYIYALHTYTKYAQYIVYGKRYKLCCCTKC